jgi:hypothetical protein
MIDPKPLKKWHDDLSRVLWRGAEVFQGEEDFLEHCISDAGDLNIGILEHESRNGEENVVRQSLESGFSKLKTTRSHRLGMLSVHRARKAMEQG